MEFIISGPQFFYVRLSSFPGVSASGPGRLAGPPSFLHVRLSPVPFSTVSFLTSFQFQAAGAGQELLS